MIITLPPKAPPTRRCKVVFGDTPAPGHAPYRTPGDPPCAPGKRPLWPGGPAAPAWSERELGYDAHALDQAPPTPEQLALLREMGRARVPQTRVIARAMILAGLHESE